MVEIISLGLRSPTTTLRMNVIHLRNLYRKSWTQNVCSIMVPRYCKRHVTLLLYLLKTNSQSDHVTGLLHDLSRNHTCSCGIVKQSTCSPRSMFMTQTKPRNSKWAWLNGNFSGGFLNLIPRSNGVKPSLGGKSHHLERSGLNNFLCNCHTCFVKGWGHINQTIMALALYGI